MPLNAYEPVIYSGGRPLDASSVDGRRVDVLTHGVTARTTDPEWVIGAKPAEFIWWLFDLLGALPGDQLDDLFPGSGGVGRAWDLYTSSAIPTTRPDVEHDPSPGPGPTRRAGEGDPSLEAAATRRSAAHDPSPAPGRTRPVATPADASGASPTTRPPASRDAMVAAGWNRPLFPAPT